MRALTGQFRQWLDDDNISEILREVSTLEDIEDANSESVLLWAQRVEAQGTERRTKKHKGCQGISHCQI